MILSRIKSIAGASVLSLALLLGVVGGVYAQPNENANKNKQQPPSLDFLSDAGAEPPKPEGGEAKSMEPLGATDLKNAEVAKNRSQSSDFSIQAGAVANVDINNTYNYCYRDRIYVQVKNSTASTQYIRVRVYNQGYWYDKYTSVAANGYANVALYGVQGSYSAYLYVWNGSTYQYDEYKGDANNCSVLVTRTYNSGGWVQLKFENTGTAYASQRTTELAPYPGSGTYTGTQYNYPAPGGAAQYRWFWVGTSPYGIVSDTLGSSTSPAYFYGDL